MAGRVVLNAAKNAATSATKHMAKKKPRRRALRAPLTITPGGAQQVKDILATNDDAIGVRLGVKTRACPQPSLFLCDPSSPCSSPSI